MTTFTPQQFVDTWRYVTLNERSAYQQHFLDLCRLVGHPSPAEMDHAGAFFRFEMGATKSTGGEGFADVWYRGHFAWEYKGKHANLDKAYQQLLQYREALENPPLLIVSDTDRIIIHPNFTSTVNKPITLALEDLLTSSGLGLLRNIFYNPDAFKNPETTEQVTEKAAAKFALLAEILRQKDCDTQSAARFLIRLLFCLFAEDTGLLPARLFTNLALNFRNKPESFTRQLSRLFEAMARGTEFGADAILQFDGRLFDGAQALELGKEGIEILIEVSRLDWAYIEPSIFGTLFERSLDPAKRSQLGAHYTSKEDILLIVEPVLMAPLRRKWAGVEAEARALAAQRDAEPADKTGAKKRAALNDKIRALLMAFMDEIAAMRVLDAACGSGNFLYLALRQLLDLWKEAAGTLGELGLDKPLIVGPSPAQLYGIEINAMAHELAQVAIQIGYIQWLRDNGYGIPTEPILQPLDTIRQMDAILAYDADGKPCEPEWPEADVIIGNPPFLGNKKMLSAMGDKYVNDLRVLYSDRLAACDLVCYWFEKARAMIESGKTKRAGLLATQAIRAGANRVVLNRIKSTGNIFYAQADRPWVLDGASVRVSMVGFDNGKDNNILFNNDKECDAKDALKAAKQVGEINADLSITIDLTKAFVLKENTGICFQGPVKVGPFDIEKELAEKMLLEANPNGKSNKEVIKPLINGSDITGRNRDMRIIDFGDIPVDEAALFEAPFEYVKRVVKPIRDQNNDKQRRTNWWRLGRSGGDLREAIRGKARIILTPRVAKHRLFVFASSNTIPDSRVFAFAREDFYFIGVLHSRLHEVWALATASRHGVGNDPTYNNTTCFETFPFPWAPGREPTGDPRVEVIAQAARTLVQHRDAWLNPAGAPEAELKKRTLTNLYNQAPTWLQNDHRALDRAVFAAYGWPADLTDEQILERLLALNLERAKG